MKPWLLNILACPIDKHHPLDSYFFTWETPEEEISENAENAGTPSSDHENNYLQIDRQLTDGTISYPAMRKIIDLSDSSGAKSLLARVIRAISELEKVEFHKLFVDRNGANGILTFYGRLFPVVANLENPDIIQFFHILNSQLAYFTQSCSCVKQQQWNPVAI